MGSISIGLSGFSYKEWQGDGLFYPPALKAAGFFGFYRERFRAVEMDGSWYQMPAESSVAKYLTETELDFRFCYKLHRKITHLARLKPEGYESLQFMVHRLAPLGRAGRLGPLLVQLPPNLKADNDRLAAFLAAAPKFWESGGSTDWRNPTLTDRPIRYAVEFRNDSWDSAETDAILASYRCARVVVDTDDACGPIRHLSDQAYFRLRKSVYEGEVLDRWASTFRSLAESGNDVFVFCKHEDAERPWDWGEHLRRALGV